MKKGYFQYHFRTLIFIFLILPAVVPLFKPYVLGTADGLGHRFRLVAFNKSLSEGILRPRWSSEAAMSYGAPLFLFNYPLPYYIASAFLRMGFSVNTSGQLLAGAGLVLSGLFMYFAIKKIAGFLAGLAAAVAYTYAPYHLLMVYTYDAWGEITAFVFPPLILFFTALLKSHKKGFVGLSFSWAALILSHNVSAVMFAPILLVSGLLILTGNNKLTFRFIKAFIIGVFISSFFWLPAFVLQNGMNYPEFIRTESTRRWIFFKPVQSQIQVASDVIKTWKSGYFDITAGFPVLMVASIGVGILLVRLLKLRSYHHKVFFHSVQGRLLLFFSVTLLLSLFLTNSISDLLWNYLPLSYILYPFRFLFAASFAASVIAGILTGTKRIVAVAVVAGAMIQGFPFTRPYMDIFPFPNDYFSHRQTVTGAPLTKKNMLIREFLPKGADFDFLVKEELTYMTAYFANTPSKPWEELSVTQGDGLIYSVDTGIERVKAYINGKTTIQLLFHRFYFQGWEATVDGKSVPISKDQYGRMFIQVPPGDHEVDLSFTTALIEKAGYVLTAAGLIILCINLLKGIKSRF